MLQRRKCFKAQMFSSELLQYRQIKGYGFFILKYFVHMNESSLIYFGSVNKMKIKDAKTVNRLIIGR